VLLNDLKATGLHHLIPGIPYRARYCAPEQLRMKVIR
jgi:hypothetical protein